MSVTVRHFIVSKDEEWIGVNCEPTGEFDWSLSGSKIGTAMTLRLTDTFKAQIRTLVEGWDTDELAEVSGQ